MRTATRTILAPDSTPRLPLGVVVSMWSMSERNSMPRRPNSPTRPTRCDRERPSRSSFHTTSSSPACSRSSSASRAGLAGLLPDTWSTITCAGSTPEWVRASTCRP